jgi:hypothetical protein
MPDSRHTDEVIISELKALKELVALRFSNLEEKMGKMEVRGEDFHKRINIVELWQANSMGKIAIIFTIIGFGVSVFLAWINNHIK